MIILKLNSALKVSIRVLLIFAFALFFLACQSKTELLSLKFDQDISKLFKGDKQLKTGRDKFFGLRGYTDNDPDNYTIDGIKLSSYTHPGSENHNKLLFYINGEVNYLGFKYSSVDQEESRRIMADLKTKYPKFQKVAARGDGESFLWDIPAHQAWIIFYQQNQLAKDGKKFYESNFIVVKKGTRIANSTDPNGMNIYDYYSNTMDPALLKFVP
ncbi:hypothetical protein [Pedobacter sp. UYP1]|jgi:hypothetical protein|uniref:hypothetical protein n=1 Tax=Pedobacter sp. UYP1 TaxID=1756396 RepID=UPI00339151B1